MDYDRLIRAFREGERGDVLVSLSHECRRYGDMELFEECFQCFLVEVERDLDLLSLVPCFLERMKSTLAPYVASRPISPLILYAILSKDLEVEAYAFNLLKSYSVIFKQGGRRIYGIQSFFSDPEITSEPLLLFKPFEMELNWTPEVLLKFLEPILKEFVEVFKGFCSDCVFLDKSFLALKTGDFSKSLGFAEKALEFTQMRQKSIMRCKKRGVPHPIVGLEDPSYLDPALVACRGILVVLKSDPRTVLNSVMEGRRILSRTYPYSQIESQDSHKLLGYLLGFSEETILDRQEHPGL